MRAPLSWLRDYAPLDAPVGRLCETLSSLGLVVEGVEEIGAGINDVVVARVLAIRPHPKADRIRLVDVDPGDGGPLQIACGAWNFAEGDLVPLAPVGAVLPGDFKISARKMRGEMSNGMLCSASELRLPDPPGSEDGLLILPADLAAPGTPLRKALGLETDVVFDLDVTPNRPDALCMAGVARDLAAALGESFRWPEAAAVPVDDSLAPETLEIDAGDLCPRFTATVLEGIPSGPSPAWMARRLLLAGMRPISGVVDVSNYVMLDVGQPNHAYDLDRLGGGGLRVRRGRPGEKLVTLDGVERELTSDDCLICDGRDAPVGVGGIMGGAAAEISDHTTRVLLEAAWFDPTSLTRTGKRLGLNSEARVRFERGVDTEVALRAVERFVTLLAGLPGGQSLRRGRTVDVRTAHLPVPATLTLRTQRVNALLGTDLTAAAVGEYLEPLGFALEPAADGSFVVGVPSWRLECSREIDLVEEVARMHGYERIARSVPAGSRSRTGGLTPLQRQRRRVRSLLAGAGLYEAWTTTFLAPGDLERAGLDPTAIEVDNPLDRSESLLRTSLLPGLARAARSNVDRQANGLALFELGRVFAPPAAGDLPAETEMMAALLLPGDDSPAGAESAVRLWRMVSDGLRLADTRLVGAQEAGLHPGRAATVQGGSGSRLGAVGELSPEVTAAWGLPGRVGWLELSLDVLVGEPRRPLNAREPSRYPASDIDLALVADESVPAASLAALLRDAGGDLVEELVLFDVYRDERIGAGRRSLAFHVRLRAADRTLSEAELGSVRERLISAAATAGAQLRT